MIKVGQVREYRTNKMLGRFVIKSLENECGCYECVKPIDAENKKTRYIHRCVVNVSDLIAEYPNWQEAVNSPEFKGE